MKKVIILISIFLLLFSLNVIAGDLFDGLIDTADIEYSEGEGEGSYRLNVLDFNDGKTIDNGLEHYLEGKYGLSNEAVLYGHASIQDGENSYLFNLKYNFYNQDKWLLSAKGGYSFWKNEYTENNYPYLVLLSNYTVNSNLTLHNNFKLDFDNNTNKSVYNGITYNIDESKKLRALVSSYNFDKMSDLSFNIKLALENKISDELLYTAIIDKNVDHSNISFRNNLEYQVWPDLKLIGDLELNTENKFKNLNAKAVKDIDNVYSVFADFNRGWDDHFSWSKVGLGIEFEI